jgi:hypothetical protein
MIAFMATFLLGLGRRIPSFPQLAQLARSAIQEQFDEDEESQETYLWMLMILGALGVLSGDDVWLAPRLTGTAAHLGVLTWEDVTRILCKFPWVNVLHDKPGRAFWHRFEIESRFR